MNLSVLFDVAPSGPGAVLFLGGIAFVFVLIGMVVLALVVLAIVFIVRAVRKKNRQKNLPPNTQDQ
ncbi:MAG: hypothetical protein LBP91_05195 [Coriobacteriales bacterium]|jgi:uncharacterized membrane protein|nr:hypothetical protein [Coriobacteriales bacterium]